MLSKKDLMNTNEYWVEELQNEIYRQTIAYMKKHQLNQNELAQKWGVSKGYISQILKGNCNFSLKKLVELSLAMGKAPMVTYIETSVFYELEQLSAYMEEKMKEPFSIKFDKITAVNSTNSLVNINLNALMLNKTNHLTIVKDNDLIAA